jgi:hypothetical protein
VRHRPRRAPNRTAGGRKLGRRASLDPLVAAGPYALLEETCVVGRDSGALGVIGSADGRLDSTLWAVGTPPSRLARAVNSVSSRRRSASPIPAFSQRMAAKHDAPAMTTKAKTITRRMG